MRRYTFYITDTFTDRPFSGAQIGVFPEADGLTPEAMQQLAEELSLPQTIFLLSSGGEATYEARIFKPFREMNFAAQAIVAAGYVLDHIGAARDGVTLKTHRGPLPLYFFRNEEGLFKVSFAMVVEPVVEAFAPPVDELADILGLKVRDFEMRRYVPKIAACGRPFLIVPLRDRGAVRRAVFDFRAWAESTAPQTAAQEILLISHRTGTPEVDFHARLVGPEIGPKEDPPVGAAMPALCGYLCSFPNLRLGTYPFTVERGGKGGRRSLLQIEMDHRSQPELAVRIGGKAVITAHGQMVRP